MRIRVRSVSIAGLAALSVTFSVGVSSSMAQEWVYRGSPGVSSPGAWYVYPRASGWTGYGPSNTWSGYVPAPVQGAPGIIAPGAYAPPPMASPVAPAVSYAPPRPYAQTPSVVNRSRPVPSSYREFGTGRPIFQHKPWLPNQ